MEDCLNPRDGTIYVQCHLSRQLADGAHAERTAFLPAKFAEVATWLKLRVNGVWEEGWLVVSTGTKRIGVPDVRKMRRTHRKRTGDSLPKRTPPPEDDMVRATWKTPRKPK